MTTDTIVQPADAAHAQALCQQATVFANIIELAVSVTRSMSTSQVQDAMGEKTLARAVMANMVANRLKQRITAGPVAG